MSVHSNLDIVNKSVRPFFFTISNVIYLVNLQNGSWVLFTISWNSLYWGSLYQGLSVSTYSARYFLWVWVPGSTLLLGNLFPGLRSRGFCPGLFRNKFTLLLLGLVLKSPLLFGPGNGCLRLEKLNLFPILSKKLWNSFCGFSDGKNDVSPDTFGGIFMGGEVGSGST